MTNKTVVLLPGDFAEGQRTLPVPRAVERMGDFARGQRGATRISPV